MRLSPRRKFVVLAVVFLDREGRDQKRERRKKTRECGRTESQSKRRFREELVDEAGALTEDEVEDIGEESEETEDEVEEIDEDSDETEEEVDESEDEDEEAEEETTQEVDASERTRACVTVKFIISPFTKGCGGGGTDATRSDTTGGALASTRGDAFASKRRALSSSLSSVRPTREGGNV